MSIAPQPRRIIAALAVTALLGGVASVADARPSPEEQQAARDLRVTASLGVAPKELQAPTVTTTLDDGVDWGDIAIGAGSAVVVMLAAGGVVVVHRHRTLATGGHAPVV